MVPDQSDGAHEMRRPGPATRFLRFSSRLDLALDDPVRSGRERAKDRAEMGSQQATAFANAIGFSRPPERLLGLLRQHDRLLADVTRKRKALERAKEDVARVADEVARRLEPIIEESRRIDAEVHAFFAELLTRPRLSKRARRAIRRVYDELQDEGVLSARPHDHAANDAGASSPGLDEDERDDDSEDDGSGDQRSSRRGNAASDRVPTAAPAGANPTLRGLFLRLARALHPDRVQDARERADRTETMKEINRAYREGDMARLAELERDLKARGAFTDPAPGAGAGRGIVGGDDVERRCAVLEQTNAALHQQLKGLRRDLRALRDSEMGRMAADIERRRRRAGKVSPFAALDADATADIQRFRVLRDYVRAFRDGEITLEAFLMGPPDDPDDEDEDLHLAFDFIEDLSELFERRARHPPAPSRRRTGPRRRR